MKKKKVILTAFVAFMLLGIISCLNHDDQEVSNVAQENSQTMSSARMSSTGGFFTPGGELVLSNSQISEVYDVTNVNDFNNLRGLIIYTVGNETGGEINLDNLKAVSVFHYRGEKLEHSFYSKNENGIFENLPYLTALSNGGSYEEINFAVFYSNIFKKHNNLSAYTIMNKAVYDTKPLANENNPNSDFFGSKNLLEKRAMTIGQLVSLELIPTQETKDVLGKLYNNYGSRCCASIPPKLTINIQEIQFPPEPPVPGEGPGENPPMNPEEPICNERKSNSMVEGTAYASNFNSQLAYELRDGIMQDSFFGLKYIEYYYNTSFHGCNMDYSDAIKIAVLMPKIFNFYNNYKGMKSTEIGIDNDMKEEVFSLIESLRQKNSNNANLNIIFDNVKKDVGFLHNKTISEINEVLY